jgi:hypothetical protein
MNEYAGTDKFMSPGLNQIMALVFEFCSGRRDGLSGARDCRPE